MTLLPPNDMVEGRRCKVEGKGYNLFLGILCLLIEVSLLHPAPYALSLVPFALGL